MTETEIILNGGDFALYGESVEMVPNRDGSPPIKGRRTQNMLVMKSLGIVRGQMLKIDGTRTEEWSGCDGAYRVIGVTETHDPAMVDLYVEKVT